MKTIVAVLLAGLSLAAAAFMIAGRYETHVIGQGMWVRVNRFSGDAHFCFVNRCVESPMPGEGFDPTQPFTIEDPPAKHDFSGRAVPAQ